ncbi:MAG: AAA family ATPase, partial [Pseudomonadota bacterium]
LGVHVYNSKSQEFQFKEGPIFTDVLLVDEVNRAGPKTQSALLEAMEERQVSIDTATLALPQDFLVVATQNPREFEGTFPLPESQLDRFMLSVSVSYRRAMTKFVFWRATAYPGR